jgi:NADPH:quinone reductase
MKAVFYTSQGPAEQVLSFGNQPFPEVGAQEVLIRLRTSGVNPSDFKIRRGDVGPMLFPLIIPHSDGAGDVESVGGDVSRDLIGKRVWVWNAQWKRAFGTAAEYISIPVSQTVLLPDHASYEAGACLGIPAMTAFHAVALVNGHRDQTILVSGGAGTVSQYIIQIAKAQGFRVLTTVSGESKALAARAAGADGIIDYRREAVGSVALALNGNRPVDAIIELDISANARLIPSVLKPHGSIVIYGYSEPSSSLPLQWLMRSCITAKFMLVYDLTQAERATAISGLCKLLNSNELRHSIGARFSLDETVAAHQAVEAGSVIGKVVINCA